MGALNGRISPLALSVVGEVEDWKKALGEVTRHRFQPLDPKSGRQQSYGWVLLSDPFDNEFSLTNIFYGEHLVGLTLRVDAITVPASQVKLHLARRVRQELRQSGKESLPKAEISRLKEDLLTDLMARSLPSIKLHEMVFNTRKNRVWFFGKAKGLVMTFAELFHETFGLTVVPDSPFTAARDVLTPEGAEKLLELGEAGFVNPEA
jgi:DNA recombination-dependent growth factor C